MSRGTDRATVHGYIEIELIKKHGKRLIHRENMLTQFGKSYVLSNGFGGLFNDACKYKSNNIRLVGERLRQENDNHPIGVYCGPANYKWTGGSKITNMLLNNPVLTQGTGLYIPGDELEGYAYADSQQGGQLAEGVTAQLSDSQQRNNRIVRKFAYQADLACEFNTIAMSTYTPDGLAGRIVPMFRSISPFVYNYSQMSGSVINKVGPHAIANNCIIYKAANDATYNLAVNTGIFTEGSGLWWGDKRQILSVFVRGNYTYVVYMAQGTYTDTSRIKIDVLQNTDGTVVNTMSFSRRDYSSSIAYGLVYYNDTLYFVDGYAELWYPLTENASGYLDWSSSTSIAQPESLATGMYAVVGNVQAGFKNVMIGLTYRSSMDWKYTPTSWQLLDDEFTATTPSTSYTGLLFNIGNGLYTLGAGESTAADWANKLDGLIEYGNLLSFHVLDESITKNVGDILYVTYAYTIV